jgi:hypothetical protein
MVPSTLEGYMQYSWGCSFASVQTTDDPFSPADQVTFIVQLRGCIGYPNNSLPLIDGDNRYLEGGSIGTTPDIFVTRLQAGSTNLLVEPINAEYLSTFSNQSQVLVSVNGARAVCKTNCSFSFTPSVPTLTSVTLTSTPALNLTLNYANSSFSSNSIGLANLHITIDNTSCISLSGSTTNIVCFLPKNADNTPILALPDYQLLLQISRFRSG